MIQRVQTIFLFLVSVAMIAMMFLPIWTIQGSGVSANLDAYNLVVSGSQNSAETVEVKNGIYIAILAGLGAILALFSIFQYRNRLLQIKLGALNSLIIGGALICAWYLSNIGNKMVETTENGEYLSGFYMPVVALLCNLMANRFIKRDEELVRSADRLR